MRDETPLLESTGRASSIEKLAVQVRTGSGSDRGIAMSIRLESLALQGI
jgi:hypothetical protein